MPLKQGTEIPVRLNSTHILCLDKKDAPKAGDGNAFIYALMNLLCHFNKKDAPKAGDGNALASAFSVPIFNKKDAPKAGDGNQSNKTSSFLIVLDKKDAPKAGDGNLLHAKSPKVTAHT